MGSIQILSNLLSRIIIALDDKVAVHLQSNPNNIPTDRHWVRVVFGLGDQNQASSGTPFLVRKQYILTCQVFSPINSHIADHLEMTETLSDVFLTYREDDVLIRGVTPQGVLFNDEEASKYKNLMQSNINMNLTLNLDSRELKSVLEFEGEAPVQSGRVRMTADGEIRVTSDGQEREVVE